MKKRINLYQDTGPKAGFDKNSLTGSAIIVIAIVAMVLLSGLGLKFYVDGKKEHLASLKAEQKQLESQVQALQAKFTNTQINPVIKAEQDRLKQQIIARRTLMSLLDQIEPEQTVSFSSYMHALADASQKDSWLTSFSIDMESKAFKASGEATEGPYVSLMLEEIGKTSSFRGMTVGALNVETAASGVRFQAVAELKVNE